MPLLPWSMPTRHTAPGSSRPRRQLDPPRAPRARYRRGRRGCKRPAWGSVLEPGAAAPSGWAPGAVVRSMPMAANRASLLQSIATTITDYRSGEVATPTAAHVGRWIDQFDPAVQLDMLVELDHVLGNTYLPKALVMTFLTGLSTHSDLVGADPCAFWESVNFLDIQAGGGSQTEMLELFSETLEASCGLTIDDCGAEGGPYVYLDDAIFTGSRLRNDVIEWLESAPSPATLHVIVIAFHRGGQWYAKTKIEEACKAAGKVLKIKWWRAKELEDRK
jgi:hypothetical protein